MAILNPTVPCPHCGKVATYNTCFNDDSSTCGQSAAQCPSCHNTFWIDIQNGRVVRAYSW